METNSFKDDKKIPEIFSKTIRAGKRTYFFDVKSTRNNEYYLTITESKKKFADDGNFRYEKHKLFLYPEDFEKFSETFSEVIEYIIENQPAELSSENNAPEKDEKKVNVEQEVSDEKYGGIEFDDF